MGKRNTLHATAAALLLALPVTAQGQVGTRAATPEQELLAASQAVANAQTSFDLEALEVEAGTPFYIFLARDLVLEGAYADQRTVARQP